MSTGTDKPSADKSAKEVNATFVILKTLADTTWRMFIPPAAGAVIGLVLEGHGLTQAAVWGAIIGAFLSGLLVWLQYRDVNRSKDA